MSPADEEKRNTTEAPAMGLKKQRELIGIKRARSRMMVCFYTLPLYVIALVLLLNEGRNITTFMFVYMAIYAIFAIDMIIKRCPACHEQFYVKGFLLNFLSKKCVHCGLLLHQQGDTANDDHERTF